MRRWKWKTRFYYAEETLLHRKGELAIEVIHAGDHSRDMEIEVGMKRVDIGLIELVNLETNSTTVVKEIP